MTTMMVYILRFHGGVSEWDGEKTLIEVSVWANEDVTGEGLDDGMEESMVEINPKVVNQFGLPTAYSLY